MIQSTYKYLLSSFLSGLGTTRGDESLDRDGIVCVRLTEAWEKEGASSPGSWTKESSLTAVETRPLLGEDTARIILGSIQGRRGWASLTLKEGRDRQWRETRLDQSTQPIGTTSPAHQKQK